MNRLFMITADRLSIVTESFTSTRYAKTTGPGWETIRVDAAS